MFEFLTDRTGSYIQRWHHRPTVFKETLAEHHLHTSRMAFWLAVLCRTCIRVPMLIPHPRAETVAVAALFHDEPETITGDIPHSTKVNFTGAYAAINAWEDEAIEELATKAPESFTSIYRALLKQTDLTKWEREIIRYADDLAALAYLNDQLNHGMHAPEILQLQASVLAMARGRDYDWLNQLRRLFNDLP